MEENYSLCLMVGLQDVTKEKIGGMQYGAHPHFASRVELAPLMPSGGGFLASGTHPHLSTSQHLPCSHLALLSLEMLWSLGLQRLCHSLGGHPRGCTVAPCKRSAPQQGAWPLCVMLAGAHTLAQAGSQGEDSLPSAVSDSLSAKAQEARQGGVSAWGPLGTVATPSHSQLQTLVPHQCQALVWVLEREQNRPRSLCSWVTF